MDEPRILPNGEIVEACSQCPHVEAFEYDDYGDSESRGEDDYYQCCHPEVEPKSPGWEPECDRGEICKECPLPKAKGGEQMTTNFGGEGCARVPRFYPNGGELVPVEEIWRKEEAVSVSKSIIETNRRETENFMRSKFDRLVDATVLGLFIPDPDRSDGRS